MATVGLKGLIMLGMIWLHCDVNKPGKKNLNQRSSWFETNFSSHSLKLITENSHVTSHHLDESFS